ncbi:hypothetical protein JNJ66_02595 [Candidatus Saccharibacteria bacterium]|nr:hypothetical protein [Candidatus Saccharibacteria bacterium]
MVDLVGILNAWAIVFIVFGAAAFAHAARTDGERAGTWYVMGWVFIVAALALFAVTITLAPPPRI